MVKKSGLGTDPLKEPLSQGIFTKTSSESTETKEEIKKKEDSRKKNKDSIFLMECEREKINLRIPVELNDWLDGMLKKGKRKHGRKIPKELWLQGALELLRVVVGNEVPQNEDFLRRQLAFAADKAKKKE